MAYQLSSLFYIKISNRPDLKHELCHERFLQKKKTCGRRKPNRLHINIIAHSKDVFEWAISYSV